MRILSARDGYKYLLPIVAAVDDDRSMSTALACCYAEAGTPPPRRRWSRPQSTPRVFGDISRLELRTGQRSQVSAFTEPRLRSDRA